MSSQPGQVRKCRNCDLVETDYTKTKCQACGDMLLPVQQVQQVQQVKGRKSATKKAQRKSATKKVQKKSATKKKTQKK